MQLVMMIFLMLLTLRILAHAKDRKRNLSRKLIEENNNEFEQVAKVVEEHMRNREMIDEDKEDFNPNHEGNPVNRMSVEGAYIPYESQLSFFHRERYPRRQYRSCIIPEPNNSEVKSVLIYTETYFRQQVFHTGSRVLTNEEVYRRYQYKLEQISDLGQ